MKTNPSVGKSIRLLSALALGIVLTAVISWLPPGRSREGFAPGGARAAAAFALGAVREAGRDGATALFPPDGRLGSSHPASAPSARPGPERGSDPAPAADGLAAPDALASAAAGQPSSSAIALRSNPLASTSFEGRDLLISATAGPERPSGGWDWREKPDAGPTVGAGGFATIGTGVEGYDSAYGTGYDVHIQGYRDHPRHFSFSLAAPELEIKKWNAGGYARPGGVYVYGLYYRNNGDSVSADTVIVDTLPPLTSHAGDTSGLPVVEAGDVITWNVGELAPGGQGVFMVTLSVDPGAPSGAGAIGVNCATITTTTPGDSDPGNNECCTDPVDVWEDEVEVGVEAGAEPGDPTPGQEFDYVVKWCNNRGSAVGPLWLTDTLPISTTFVGWRPESWDRVFWTEVVTMGGQVVLYAPGYPGASCDGLRIWLLLDAAAQVSSTLLNYVEIRAEGDVFGDNDLHSRSDAHISPPRYDMRVEKGLNGGMLFPGGKIEYGIGYHNQGNSAVHVWLTDTLPAGTSFDHAWRSEWGEDQPVEPVTVTDEYVVWDLGVVGVNQGSNYNVLLNVGGELAPYDVLKNCVEVGFAETEVTPRDNSACVGTAIYADGLPNLYALKAVRDYWPGNKQIRYRVAFGNYGSETVHNVRITDTLPLSTTYESHEVHWNASHFTSTVTSEELLVEVERMEPGWGGEILLTVLLDEPEARLHWYTNTVEIDTPPDDANAGDNSDEVSIISGGEVDRVDLDVWGTWMWGEVPEGPVTITTPYSQTVIETDGGFKWEAPDLIEPGDIVILEAALGLVPVVVEVPDPFDAYASSITDTAWGQIDHLDGEWIEVQLEPGPGREVQTDGDGNYDLAFPDVPRGGEGEVRWRTVSSYATVTFHRHFRTADLLMTVDYAHDWVHGNYEPGHTVWITVTEGDGAIKGVQVLETAPMPEWGGQSGFETRWEGWVPGPGIDIVPGDWVYGRVDSGYTSSVHVGLIEGEVSVDSDTVSGTISAPWLAPDLVVVRCEIHEEGGQGIEVGGIGPEGGTYLCDFGGIWDIQPGHNVAVNYVEPGGDRVQTHPSNPAPRLRIEKWVDGEGKPSVDGNFVFQVEYWNEGGMAAENTLVTDTMEGMTYIADTLGLPHSGTGGPGDPIVWEVGTVLTDTRPRFEVFVAVTRSVSETITNTVQIATSDPFDQGGPEEKYREWVGHVVESDTHLNVGKHAWTGDSAPGTDFVYQLDVCNKGSTASSGLVLTDTLHPSMTLHHWWARQPGWEEIASGPGRIVISRPSIPGQWCGEVYLRVHLTDTAWSGMYITNTAVISASNDLEDEDNEAFWEGKVNDPHINLYVHKSWARGQLTPGGEIRYILEYWNTGNVPVDGVLITDTLPVSTTFLELRRINRYKEDIGPVTPSYAAPDYVLWEVGPVENGDGGYFEIALAVDHEALVSAVLTNTAEISRLPGEDWHDDNIATWVETLYGDGPALRVHKGGQWDDWGENTRRATYWMSVENVGSLGVAHVTVTDTYGTAMMLDSGLDTDWKRVEGWGDDPAGGLFTVTYASLGPGDGIHLNFGGIVPGSGPLPFGLAFTNTVEVTQAPGDTDPADNRDHHILTTGPDLAVVKELMAGDPRPGEVVTFSLVFGNDRPGHEWFWTMRGNARLTDTLPAEVAFITSTLRSCDWCPIAPKQDGNDYVWTIPPLPAGGWDEVRVTARLSTTLVGGEVITNVVEIRSDDAVDIEWWMANNVSELSILVGHPPDSYEIYLPLVMRAY